MLNPFARKQHPEGFELKFSTRLGHQNAFARLLTLRAPDGKPRDYLMHMETVAGVRCGKIHSLLRGDDGILLTDEQGNLVTGKVLWTGELPKGPPPTRAFAFAAGLCDENGQSNNLPLPKWAR